MRSDAPVPLMSANGIACGPNCSGAFEDRSIGHRHLRAKPGMAEVRPVTDFAILRSDDVVRLVTTHGGEKGSLALIGEDDCGPRSWSDVTARNFCVP